MHLDNWLFILLVAMAALFRLLASKATDAAKKNTRLGPPSSTPPPRSNQPPSRPPADTEEERIRRFLEALGQPTSAPPPPPVKPRTTYERRVVFPRVPPFPAPLPPLKTRPPDLPRQTEVPRPVIVPETKPITRKPAEAAIFEVQEGSLPSESPAPADAHSPRRSEQLEVNWAGLIGSSEGLRNAIILREIFGTPRSLQPLDLIGRA